MLKRHYRVMNEFNPEASAGAATQEPPRGMADGAIETSNEPGAQSSDTQESGTQEKTEFSVDSLPSEAQDLIKSLRAENAKHRTEKNNFQTRLEKMESGLRSMFGEGDGEEQDLTPEQKIEKMQASNQDLTYQNAIMGLAYENSIPMDNYEYFNFLMEKAVNGLEEGQELEEENLLSIIQKAKSFKQSVEDTNTSVNEGEEGNGNPEGSSAITLEAFAKMNVVEKSELYRKSPEVYNSLMAQAKQGKLIK